MIRRRDLGSARALLHENLLSFVQYAFANLNPTEQLSNAPYLEAFAYQLEQCARGHNRRYIACLPPRHLKSFTLVCMQAWWIGRNPSAKMLSVCYGDELARTFTDLFRRIVHSSWYADIFPRLNIKLADDRLGEFRTSSGGTRRSATVQGALTGFGGNIIICDDLTKAQDANSPLLREQLRRFVDEVLLSRFNNQSTGVLIAAQQRLHVDDIIDSLRQLRGVVQHNFPACPTVPQSFPIYHGATWDRAPGELLDPERQPKEILDEIKLRNPLVYAAQYQCEPEVAASSMIDLTKVTFVQECPPWKDMITRVQFWDTAEEVADHNDYSVGTSWGWHKGVWYLFNVHRGKYEFPRLKAMIWECAKKYRVHNVFIELAGSGRQLVQQLRSEDREIVWGREVEGDKAIRFFTATEFLQSPQVAILDGQPWTSDFRGELGGFPYQNHDDIVDSVSMFAAFALASEGRALNARMQNGGINPRPNPKRRSRYDKFDYGDEEGA